MTRNRRVVWTAKARKDLRAIHRHIAKFNPSSANLFVKDLHEKMQTLAGLGLTGASRSEMRLGIRLFVYRKRCFYVRIEPDNIVVLRVLHGRRNINSGDFPESES